MKKNRFIVHRNFAIPIYYEPKWKRDLLQTWGKMKLKMELEVLTTIREHFRNKMGCTDKEMADCFTNEATSKLVRKEI